MHPPYGFMDLFTVILPDWFLDNTISWYFDGKLTLYEVLLGGNWLVDNVILPLNVSD